MPTEDATSTLDCTVPELPTLSPGISFLASDDRPTGALHSLVVDHVLREGGPAYWVDARGHARTGSLARVVPSRRTLDRIRIARGFTAFQHFALVDALQYEARAAEPSLLVLPALDVPYRADDLRGEEGETMLVRAIAAVAGFARRHDVPVLVTRYRDDDHSTPIETAAERTIRYERTDLGPRFVGQEFETLVYPQADGTVQTTLAFWQRVCRARAAEHDPAMATDPDRRAAVPASSSPSTPEVIARGTY